MSFIQGQAYLLAHIPSFHGLPPAEPVVEEMGVSGGVDGDAPIPAADSPVEDVGDT